MNLTSKKSILKILFWGFWIVLGIVIYFRHGSDFDIFYKGAHAIIFGYSPYYLDPGEVFTPFRYPPSFALLFSPLALLPQGVAKEIWYAMNVFSFILTMILLWKMRKGWGLSEKEGVRSFLIAFLLSLPFIVYHLSVGQSKLFMLFFLVASFYAVEKGKDFWGGLCLIISVVIYFPLILFILFFFLKRNFKFLFGVVLGIVLWFYILPSFFFGIKGNILFLKEWYQTLVGPYLAHPESFGHESSGILKLSSQSLPSAFARLFSVQPGGRWSLYLHENLIDFSPRTLHFLLKGISYMMIGLSSLVLLGKRGPHVRLLEYSLFLILAFLLPSYSLTYNWALLFVPYLGLLSYMEGTVNPKGRCFARMVGGLSVLASFSVISDFLRAISGLFWGTFILWLGILLIVLFTPKYTLRL
ncbi:MAG: DUF2029 domain-containing protein [Chlamydiae bacterium]|nr:DUF2029 domain-containing protein [Chlamydiota bacterium]MBI3276765.1 DUF2029 domain-containing protein [Chlamydiota bacterium]